jgi:hypothetical protein
MEIIVGIILTWLFWKIYPSFWSKSSLWRTAPIVFWFNRIVALIIFVIMVLPLCIMMI